MIWNYICSERIWKLYDQNFTCNNNMKSFSTIITQTNIQYNDKISASFDNTEKQACVTSVNKSTT